MPEAARETLFYSFVQGKGGEKYSRPDTGLGLTISKKKIVEKHGGTIAFTTELDRGTVFYFDLAKINLDASAAYKTDYTEYSTAA